MFNCQECTNFLISAICKKTPFVLPMKRTTRQFVMNQNRESFRHCQCVELYGLVFFFHLSDFLNRMHRQDFWLQTRHICIGKLPRCFYSQIVRGLLKVTTRTMNHVGRAVVFAHLVEQGRISAQRPSMVQAICEAGVGDSCRAPRFQPRGLKTCQQISSMKNFIRFCPYSRLPGPTQ